MLVDFAKPLPALLEQLAGAEELADLFREQLFQLHPRLAQFFGDSFLFCVFEKQELYQWWLALC